MENGTQKVLMMNKTIKKIIQKRKSGQTLVDAAYTVTGDKLKRKIQPPKNGLFDETYLNSLKNKVYPRGFKNINRLSFRMRKTINEFTRQKLSKQAFSNGTLGIILIKPELLPFTLDVRKFLSKLGCQITLSKVNVLSPYQLESIYQPEMHKWRDFPINAAILISGPSRILVFKHAPKKVYIDLLRKTNLKLYSKLEDRLQTMPIQELFHAAVKGLIDEGRTGTLRGEITHKRLKEFGFNGMTGVSKQLDPTGYLKNRVQNQQSIFNILTGIHSPSSTQDLINHSNTLLSRKELSKIIRQLPK